MERVFLVSSYKSSGCSRDSMSLRSNNQLVTTMEPSSSSSVENARTSGYWMMNGSKKKTRIILSILMLIASANSEEIEISTRPDKNSMKYGITSNRTRDSRFISLDSSAGNIDIDLDLSIPFLSIPLQDNKGKNAPGTFPMPLVKLNTKALAIFGTLMAIMTFVIPLLFKQVPEQPPPYNYLNYAKEHKRSDRSLDFLPYFGDSFNEILGKNNSMLPCLERLVCSAVVMANRADEPTSFDKIINALSSHRLFEEVVNVTVIRDAATRGRRASSTDDCVTTSSKCAFDQKILLNFLKIIGL